MEYPRVGLGVLLFNSSQQLLLGKRKNSHGENTWSPPGGHLEFGENFEKCAAREVLEETGIELIGLTKFVAVTNDIFTEEKRHYVTLFMTSVLLPSQTPVVTEPHKMQAWTWFDQAKLPENLFLPLKNLLAGRDTLGWVTSQGASPIQQLLWR